MFKALTALVVTVLLGAVFLGCGESEPAGEPESSGEPEYAGIATEITLQGLSENDLEKYTRYGNPEFKASVTQEILDAAASQISSQFGAYESKEYLSTEEEGEYTIVHYRAKYARGKVGVRMVFDKDGLVAGQWFE